MISALGIIYMIGFFITIFVAVLTNKVQDYTVEDVLVSLALAAFWPITGLVLLWTLFRMRD